MSHFRWIDGFHDDRWLEQLCMLEIQEVDKLEFRIFLPNSGSTGNKTVSLFHNGRQIATTTLQRGVITPFDANLSVDPNRQYLVLKFDSAEDVSDDARKLGAVCSEISVNGEIWDPASLKMGAALSQPQWQTLPSLASVGISDA